MNRKIAQLPLMASLLISLSSSLPAFAQSGAQGGGKILEATLQTYIYKIDRYLETAEGQKEFPEVVKYDLKNGAGSFHALSMELRPVIQDAEIKDQNGTPRDCVSFNDKDGRRFVCNSLNLMQLTLDSQPSYYRIVFHEMLVQAGIEAPVNLNIPSEYPISSRIMETVHLESYQEWVPGRPAPKNLKSLGLYYPARIIQKRSRDQIRVDCVEGTLENCQTITINLVSSHGKVTQIIDQLSLTNLRSYAVDKHFYTSVMWENGLGAPYHFSPVFKKYRNQTKGIDENTTVFEDRVDDVTATALLAVVLPLMITYDIAMIAPIAAVEVAKLGKDHRVYRLSKILEKLTQLNSQSVEVDVSEWNFIVRTVQKLPDLYHVSYLKIPN